MKRWFLALLIVGACSTQHVEKPAEVIVIPGTEIAVADVAATAEKACKYRASTEALINMAMFAIQVSDRMQTVVDRVEAIALALCDYIVVPRTTIK